ncbi:MAG: 3-dehydroquinate synthase [Bacteroidetes bacterium]|nr:3-dehydroquinate synthase [Bacteroidota bacterium]MDA1121915.1 3-dehydroquinate synthase [Bacteroidota bacterium]
MASKNVQITDDLSSVLDRFFFDRNYTQVAVLVDENTEQACLPLVKDLIPEHWLISIVSGESNKNLSTCESIWGALTEGSFDRHSLMINLGGGVIGDMGGFCAATFKRGIDFINIPTTLLSQVDASVGGKLGIDFQGFKNHIGVFKDPELVIIDPVFLKSLPNKELRSGFAEAIKHCLIADRKRWDEISQKNLDTQNWVDIIGHSVAVKEDIVAGDPFEKGQRKLLNFGHTIGHAIESTYLDRGEERLLHGEAIAIGMICESYLSKKKSGLQETELNEIVSYINRIFGLPQLDKEAFEEMVELISQDKKNQGKVINCTLLKTIGEGVVNIPISTGDVIDALFYYNQLSDK